MLPLFVQTAQATAFTHNLCRQHQVWMRSPLEVSIPILCWQKRGDEGRIGAWRNRAPHATLVLPLLADVQLRPEDANRNLMKEPLQSAASGVEWATLLEYATTTYGIEKLPVLLAALSQHEEWETLVPSVFGLSLAEFENGWQAFLEAQ